MFTPTVPARCLMPDGRTLHPWYLQQALRRRIEAVTLPVITPDGERLPRTEAAGARLLRRWRLWRILTRRSPRAS